MWALQTLTCIIFIISIFNLLRVTNFIKTWANFSVWTKFPWIHNFGSRSSVPNTIFIISMFNLHLVPNFIELECIKVFRPNLPKFLISSQGPQFSNIIFKINKLDLLWVPNFIAMGIYFIFETKLSWNEGIETSFNVECVTWL